MMKGDESGVQLWTCFLVYSADTLASPYYHLEANVIAKTKTSMENYSVNKGQLSGGGV